MRDQEIIQMAQRMNRDLADMQKALTSTIDGVNDLAKQHATTANVLKGFLTLPLKRRLRWLVLGR